MDLYKIREELNMGKPLTSMNLKVTFYARVSTEHLEQQKSLKNQVEHFEEYIKQNPSWTYVDEYIDSGISGTTDVKRDNFMKMIEDAKCGKFDLIITKEISRFSRNTLDSIRYTRLLLSYGVAVFFVNDNINTALPDSELRLTIMSSLAQDEIRRLSERVKFGMNRAIERGEILGNNMLYGYRKNKDLKILEIVESEAKIVKEIYTLYAEDNYSLSKIAKKLNKENIKTGRGCNFSVSTISRMIENPKYKGYYCGRKTEIIDYISKKVKYLESQDWVYYEDKKRIPPIVSDILWNKANEKLKMRKEAFRERKNNKEIYKDRYLYSSKIYCREHNCVFHRRKFRTNNKDITWVCSMYLKNGKEYCNSPNIREKELNLILESFIEYLDINLSKVVNLLMNFYENQEYMNDNKSELEKLKRKIKNIYVKKEKLLELNVENFLSCEDFKIQNEFLNEQLAKLNEKIDELKACSFNLDKDKNIEKLRTDIKLKLKSKKIIDKIKSILLERIVASTINDDKNNLRLDIFVKLDCRLESNLLWRKKFSFDRGYDTRSTPRYSVNYDAYFYLAKG